MKHLDHDEGAVALACGGLRRRLALFDNARWNGIDFVEVGCDQSSLCVHFFGHVPQGLTPANVHIEGGRRVRGIIATQVWIDAADDPERDDCLHIALDKDGDFSIYRLCLVNLAPDGAPLAQLDPRYACVDFSFKVDCPSEFDCRVEPVCVAAAPEALEISYLAKDYQSFRQLMLDRMALTMPDWRERHVPDLGITLVELLAYQADMLSYYQDAVATEAYLETARRRISVRRHLRLLDYRLHEGCNARAWLALTTDQAHSVLPADVYFATASRALAGINGSAIVSAFDAEALPAGDHRSFQPMLATDAAGIDLYQAHNIISIYTWGDSECCLPKGATRASLLDQRRDQEPAQRMLHLKAGDVLIFQERIGPRTGAAADRDPAHRHAVRLTEVRHGHDQLFDTLVLEVCWAAADALPFELCLSVRLGAPDCAYVNDISIALGNVILVEHGMPVTEECGVVQGAAALGECACDGSIVDAAARARPFQAGLRKAPLTHSEPPRRHTPASLALVQDARLAMPRVALDGENVDGVQHWEARADLLASSWEAHQFVAEIDDDGYAQLRFGDGELGAMPTAGTTLRARYKVGNGIEGNVGAESITTIVYRSGLPNGAQLAARNPMAAAGGIAPEPVLQAKLNAPDAFRQVLQRAVTAQDYAELAQADSRIERAEARLRWNGSWYVACVALDPYGASEAGPALLKDVARRLYRYRRMGHDLALRQARYVALEVRFEICVLPHYLRAHVKAALADVFSNRRLADGTLGLFHPDRLTFGGAITSSALIGAAQAVDGVQSVCLVALQRSGEGPDGELERGLLQLAAGQIALLDNDPNFPEHGKLTFDMGGGR